MDITRSNQRTGSTGAGTSSSAGNWQIRQNTTPVSISEIVPAAPLNDTNPQQDNSPHSSSLSLDAPDAPRANAAHTSFSQALIDEEQNTPTGGQGSDNSQVLDAPDAPRANAAHTSFSQALIDEEQDNPAGGQGSDNSQVIDSLAGDSAVHLGSITSGSEAHAAQLHAEAHDDFTQLSSFGNASSSTSGISGAAIGGSDVNIAELEEMFGNLSVSNSNSSHSGAENSGSTASIDIPPITAEEPFFNPQSSSNSGHGSVSIATSPNQTATLMLPQGVQESAPKSSKRSDGASTSHYQPDLAPHGDSQYVVSPTQSDAQSGISEHQRELSDLREMRALLNTAEQHLGEHFLDAQIEADNEEDRYRANQARTKLPKTVDAIENIQGFMPEPYNNNITDDERLKIIKANPAMNTLFERERARMHEELPDEASDTSSSD